ncbi:HNH/ENDO VII family nuclease, partial [Bartonella sp. ML70XJBT.G]|uniref:HNH/ENDO VII family nuclease n=1 Tax=Bartonella sp. ML70XJBT.G TaxID=3019093 RepID=UPI002362F3D4
TVTQIIAHAGLGCLVGATANGDCRAGAIGGAVGEATAMLQFKLLVQGVVKEEMGDLNGRTPTAEEEARINAKIDALFANKESMIDVARVAGGFAAALTGGDVNTGADAAGNAAENNYLSSAQRAQMEKELKECPDKWCRKDVAEKWHEIDDQQDVFFSVGVVAGVPAELFDTAQGFWQIVRHPKETLKALKELVTSGNVTETVKQSYLERINYLEEEFQKAGIRGSFNAGLEFGKLLTEAASLLAGGAGAVKGGIKLGEKALAKFASKAEAAAATGNKVSHSLGEISNEVNATHSEKEIAQSLEKMSDEAIATQYFGQERKFWSKPIEVGFEITNKGEKINQINKVYQREDLFDPNRIVTWTVKGKEVKGTNIERMKTGRAPLDANDNPIELHHMLQTHDGPIAEVSSKFHNEYHSTIHINPNTMGSAIDRDAFALWRQKYWKERAKMLEENMKLKK